MGTNVLQELGVVWPQQLYYGLLRIFNIIYTLVLLLLEGDALMAIGLLLTVIGVLLLLLLLSGFGEEAQRLSAHTGCYRGESPESPLRKQACGPAIPIRIRTRPAIKANTYIYTCIYAYICVYIFLQDTYTYE